MMIQHHTAGHQGNRTCFPGRIAPQSAPDPAPDSLITITLLSYGACRPCQLLPQALGHACVRALTLLWRFLQMSLCPKRHTNKLLVLHRSKVQTNSSLSQNKEMTPVSIHQLLSTACPLASIHSNPRSPNRNVFAVTSSHLTPLSENSSHKGVGLPV